MFQFSTGTLFGLAGTIPVPRKFGALQDVSVDVSFTTKSLYGQNQYALAIARGQAKLTGKAKFAKINAAMLNDLFFSQSIGTGSAMPIFGEVGNIPATPGPYTVTVSQSAQFREDLGVIYSATGVPLTRVASGPTTGQYSVAAGVYTFAAADQGQGVLIDYSYNVAASGSVISLNQVLSGTTPTFGIVLAAKYQAPGDVVRPLYLKLNACTSSKLSLATKMDDFNIPEFDFEAMADITGAVGAFLLGE